jgi:hypothetical protein
MPTTQKAVLTGSEILDVVRGNYDGVQDVILCAPFVTKDGLLPILKILAKKTKIHLTLITRWEPLDLLLHYSEVEAFEALFKRHAFEKWDVNIYVVDDLHAKALVLGHRVAVLGSANMLRDAPLEQLRSQPEAGDQQEGLAERRNDL